VPLVNLVSLPFLNAAPVGTDLLPDATAFVGTEEVYGQVGAVLRLGQGLQDDFGAAKIMPGMSGGDAYNPGSGFAW
jgi:hypothetical protein